MDQLKKQPDSEVSLSALADREGMLSLDSAEQGPLVVKLWTDFFRHLSTLGVAGSAGLMVLLEVGILEGGTLFWFSLAPE